MTQRPICNQHAIGKLAHDRSASKTMLCKTGKTHRKPLQTRNKFGKGTTLGSVKRCFLALRAGEQRVITLLPCPCRMVSSCLARVMHIARRVMGSRSRNHAKGKLPWDTVAGGMARQGAAARKKEVARKGANSLGKKYFQGGAKNPCTTVLASAYS